MVVILNPSAESILSKAEGLRTGSATLWERDEESLFTAESREIPHSFAKPQSFGMTVSALV